MTLTEVQDQIIDEFSVFDDWLDKYDYLIGLSETLPAIAPEHRTERYLIEGCQSRVWVDAKLEDGRVYYAADSDAIITKGIIALLIRVLNGRTPQEILDTVNRTVRECGSFKHIYETNAGCTISCHCGEGTLGVLYLHKLKN